MVDPAHFDPRELIPVIQNLALKFFSINYHAQGQRGFKMSPPLNFQVLQLDFLHEHQKLQQMK